MTEKLLGKAFSSSAISKFSKQLGAELKAWRTRQFDKEYAYIFVEAAMSVAAAMG